jgi:hypothetical protein
MTIPGQMLSSKRALCRTDYYFHLSIPSRNKGVQAEAENSVGGAHLIEWIEYPLYLPPTRSRRRCPKRGRNIDMDLPN